METVIHLSLSGHPVQFQLDEDGYECLRSYFRNARSRLKRNPDRDEILRDLERSIGEKFNALLRPESCAVSGDEVDAVLRKIGMVDNGNGAKEVPKRDSSNRKGPCRIDQGKWFSGVCTGLAAYSGVDVGWVRTIFILATLFTGGIVILIYLTLMFALPLVPTPDDFEAASRGWPRTT